MSRRPLVATAIAAAYRWAIGAFVVGLAGACAFGGEAAASTEQYRQVQVEVIGEGRPVLMIPGLNSGADTWRETCAALQAEHVQCHLVHLPGFAGRPAATDRQGDFLADMRDRLLAYIDERKLDQPVVIGHSLGGVLALEMALKSPDSFERLVIVDSLPFYTALQNPSLTQEQARPIAEGMRTQMLSQDAASYEKATASIAKGLARDAGRVQTLADWGRASDRTATTDAMYSMMVTDLRAPLAQLKTPTLVLGSWAAYAPYGSTLESTRAIFQAQYAQLAGVRIEMSQAGYHFLMWDDPSWVQAQVSGFIGAGQH